MPKLPALPTAPAKSRHLGGTTNYIAEYLLMLSSLVALATSIVLMVFSICTLLKEGNTTALSTSSALSASVAFVVFGPLYYVLSSRVRAEELKNPSVVAHKARTVFYVLATIAAFSWFTGFVVTAVYYLLSPLVTKNSSYSEDLVTVFIPAVVAAVVIATSYVSVAKKAGSAYLAKFTNVALLAGLILLIATLSVGIAKKNTKPSLKSGEKCTYTNYRDGKCTYNEYQKYLDGLYDDYKSPTSDYEDYRYNNNVQDGLDSLYNL
ncbi:hypothetical protein KC957_02380 [Candidatus Saccharibacteria bacterium]|nr:hypothetical protein [Candidatus Saccharibacteria bacterium]